MVAFFSTLLRLFLQVFRSRRTILSEIALLKKENEILLRKMGKKKAHFGFYDKLFLVVLNRAADINQSILSPSCPRQSNRYQGELHGKGEENHLKVLAFGKRNNTPVDTYRQAR